MGSDFDILDFAHRVCRIPPQRHGLPHGVTLAEIDSAPTLADEMTTSDIYEELLTEEQREQIACDFVAMLDRGEVVTLTDNICDRPLRAKRDAFVERAVQELTHEGKVTR